jgi:class 3 adenylate cyclase
MKRKIVAIMAADIAGYSKLVAEDEEETLRRLASYQSVFEEFITRFGGRIFNTAGDAIFTEFPSPVEAVRCAIDVQESLRTRNLAYPASRQMSFRIGITIGDVVERNGDLLGDGVNIAARLQSVAQPGGVCISRTVYEQVVNKLSVEFTDLGEQELKNIPTPVHAFTLTLGTNKRELNKIPRQSSAVCQRVATPAAIWSIIAVAVSVAAMTFAATLYFGMTQPREPPAPASVPTVAAVPAATNTSTPSPADVPKASSMAAVAIDLNGIWQGNDGGIYTVRRSGTQVSWEGVSGDGGESWTHTFNGTMHDNVIVGTFFDHPPGKARNSGELKIVIVDANRLERVASEVRFSGTAWTRTASTQSKP